MKILKTTSIGLLITIGVISAFTFFTNNLLIHSSKVEIVNAEITNLTRSYSTTTKTRRFRIYLNNNEEKIVLLHPKSIIKEMYRNRDNYIGKTIEIKKIKNYNKKNKIISEYYKLMEDK